ncbi:hypothetical protein [Nonomuraea sp. NPDC049129]|uniref:hypothetical protein n=1 Tax=unclassified Nonomuraea TaxID=2593643 RepID=UPI0033F69464
MPAPLQPANRTSRSVDPVGVMPGVAIAVPVPEVEFAVVDGALPPDTATRMPTLNADEW